MTRNWSTKRPDAPGWYFFRCDAHAEQLAWMYVSSGQWFAMIRYDIPVSISELSNAQFDGPLTDAARLIDRQPPNTMDAVMAQLGVIESELE